MPSPDPGRTDRIDTTTFDTTPGTCEDLRGTLRDACAPFSSRRPGVIGAALDLCDAQTGRVDRSQGHRRAASLASLRSTGRRARTHRLFTHGRSVGPVMYVAAAADG